MRVLMFGPWPIGRPRHGGQIRASSIAAAYRARGHEVRFIGVFDPNNVPISDTTSEDVPIDSRVMDYIARSGKSWELSLWDAFAEVPALFAGFEATARRFRPDVVQFEEPYLWPVVRALRDRGHLGGAHIVHSSYNFETDYRRDLAEIAGTVNEAVLRHVTTQEAEIARASDIVAVVSDADAASFRRLGARQVVVVRNGSRYIEADPSAVAGVDAFVGRTNFALFVSSAHPPNARGLLDLARGAPGRLAGLLLICGAVERLLAPHRRTHTVIRDARMLGIVDPAVLDALLIRAAVVLLPKTRGGGSNLKTSEALVAGRPVVATTQAFVGFEPWQDAPSVTVEDDPVQFWQHVERHLSKPAESLALSSYCDDLLWPACIAPLITAIENMVVG